MSGNFFDIEIEPLAIRIRNHPHIIPAPLSPSFSKVIGIHVDDVWLNTADSASMKTGIKLVFTFATPSGSVVSVSKSFLLNHLDSDLFD